MATDLTTVSAKQTRRTLYILLLGATMVSFSNSALNPAIPVFMTVFSVDIVMGSWLLNAYVLAMSIGLLLSGYLNRKFGFKKLYLAAIMGFTLGSLIGMTAQSMLLVIIARVVQGLAGGFIIPLSLGLLYQLYPKSMQGKIMALWGITIMLSLAFGPLLGAYLLEQFAWWMLFAITLPLSTLVIVMIGLWLPEVSAIQESVKFQSFDKIGFIGFLGWLLMVMIWLNKIRTDGSWQTLSFIIVIMLAAGAWWWYESKQPNPILEIGLFENKVYLHSTVISVTQSMGLMLCLLLLPIIIQDLMQLSALWTGAIFMIATVVTSVTSHYAGRIVDSRGARNISLIGIVISALAMLMLAWCLYEPTLWLLMLTMSVHGVGVGLAYLPTMSVGLSSLPYHSVTQGAALNNISRRLLSTIFVVIATVYINSDGSSVLSNRSVSFLIGTQHVFVFIGITLFFTLLSAHRLPKTRNTNN